MGAFKLLNLCGQNFAFQRSFKSFSDTHIYNMNPESDKQINLRGVSGDELVAVLQRGQSPDGAILGVQYLELEAALVGVGQTPGHVEVGASL